MTTALNGKPISPNGNAEFYVETAVKADHTNAPRWIFSYVKKNWYLLVGILIGAAGNAYLAAFVAIYIGIAFDAVLATPADLGAVGWAAIAIILSQTARAILQLGRNFF
ncbi:MAG: hypothetical protein AAF633_24105, partial [Chloroflexota bacterium]